MLGNSVCNKRTGWEAPEEIVRPPELKTLEITCNSSLACSHKDRSTIYSGETFYDARMVFVQEGWLLSVNMEVMFCPQCAEKVLMYANTPGAIMDAHAALTGLTAYRFVISHRKQTERYYRHCVSGLTDRAIHIDSGGHMNLIVNAFSYEEALEMVGDTMRGAAMIKDSRMLDDDENNTPKPEQKKGSNTKLWRLVQLWKEL